MAAKRAYLIPLTEPQADALVRVDEGFEADLKSSSPLKQALDAVDEAVGRQSPTAEKCANCQGSGWAEPGADPAVRTTVNVLRGRATALRDEMANIEDRDEKALAGRRVKSIEVAAELLEESLDAA